MTRPTKPKYLDQADLARLGRLPAHPEDDTVPFVLPGEANAKQTPSKSSATAHEMQPPPIEWADAEPEPSNVTALRSRRRRSQVVTTTTGKRFERGDHVELAEQLVSDLAPPGQLAYAEDFLWRYDDSRGRWCRVDSAEASRVVQGYAGRPCGSAEGKDPGPLDVSAGAVFGAIKLAQDRVADSSGEPFFRASAVAFANGVAFVDAGRLRFEPGCPELRARWGFDFDLARPAPTPERFVRMLEGIFRDDADRDEKIQAVQEFFGACCLGIATRFGKCLVLKGPSAENGKSTVITIASRAMPPGSVSSIAPQDMGGEYARADLAGVHLNAVEELPERELLDAEAFKNITTGGLVRARRIYGRPFEFTARAGHVFAANALPSVADVSNGFWRRVLILTFNRSFTNDPERRPGLVEEVLAAELPAITSWLVAGAERALERGAYTTPPSHDVALAAWRRDANPVALFVSECTAPLEPGQLPSVWGTRATALYERFTTWASRNGHRPMARNTLGVRLRLMGIEAVHTKSGARYPMTLADGES